MTETVSQTDKHTQRQSLLSVLSKSDYEDISAYWQPLGINPDYYCLKKPETGMVMVRARAGGDGQKFNMGEMTVTRTVVQLNNHQQGKQLGFGYTAGRHPQKSELIAVIDACYQDAQYAQRIQEAVIDPLGEKLLAKEQQHQQQVDSTKVNFFTMVRGE